MNLIHCKTYLLNASLLCITSMACVAHCYCQKNEYENRLFLKTLYKDSTYRAEKERIIRTFAHAVPGNWGEFVKGVDEELVVKGNIVALTFDACGGRNGDGFDSVLIDYLQKENIPATLFISGKWIDENYETFIGLSLNNLFEIENHGLNHRPCSVDGESEYGIQGTSSVSDAFDEIEANALKIERITGCRPKFYRSATAFIDEACAKIAGQIGITVISFDILSGDASPYISAQSVEENVIKHLHPGAIIIMHFNHPNGHTYESLLKIIPRMKDMGYSFAKIKDFPLTQNRKPK
jgi:peptidoglycan/xylan/chitin deacetylase (PgdA/CDA1 family)